jgi:hypothetical protein
MCNPSWGIGTFNVLFSNESQLTPMEGFALFHLGQILITRVILYFSPSNQNMCVGYFTLWNVNEN